MRPENPAKSKKKSFSHEQIREEAHKIWKKRVQNLQNSQKRTAEDDWKDAIEELQVSRWEKLWRWTGIPERKGWDILELALIPFCLLLLAYGFQSCNSQSELQAAENKAQQETLVKYLEQMEKAMKTDDLLHAQPDPDKSGNIFLIAQIRTVTALQSLNPKKQRRVINFLKAAHIFEYPRDSELKKPKDFRGLLYQARMAHIDLHDADLGKADLSLAKLSHADLRNTDLSYADLSNAKLHKTDLSGANLSHADLRNTDLSNTDLSNTDLSNAKLNDANLHDTQNLTNAQIKSACNWEKAIYTKADWDDKNNIWVVKDQKANDQKINEIKQDKASDPINSPDCSN